MKSLLLAAAALFLLVGCTQKADVVGMWKVEPAPSTGTSFHDVADATLLNARTQGMKVEFTSDNKVRFMNFQGESRGTYEIQGSEVTIHIQSYAPTQPMKMKLEGGKLREATEFKSNVGLVLVRE